MLWDFPDGPVFKTPHFRARVVASIPVRDLWSHMPLGAGEKNKQTNKKKKPTTNNAVSYSWRHLRFNGNFYFS